MRRIDGYLSRRAQAALQAPTAIVSVGEDGMSVLTIDGQEPVVLGEAGRDARQGLDALIQRERARQGQAPA